MATTYLVTAVYRGEIIASRKVRIANPTDENGYLTEAAAERIWKARDAVHDGLPGTYTEYEEI